MTLANIRRRLLGNGLAWLYVLFLLGYFALPMSGTLQKFFYLFVLPSGLLLAPELLAFYRGNRLFQLFLGFTAYMLLTLIRMMSAIGRPNTNMILGWAENQREKIWKWARLRNRLRAHGHQKRKRTWMMTGKGWTIFVIVIK